MGGTLIRRQPAPPSLAPENGSGTIAERALVRNRFRGGEPVYAPRHITMASLLMLLAISSASACTESRRSHAGWSPPDDASAPSDSVGVETRSDSVGVETSVSRADAGDLPCAPKPICAEDDCRLDLSLPRLAHVQVELDWNGRRPEEPDGSIGFIPDVSRSTGREAPLKLTNAFVSAATRESPVSLELRMGTYDVYRYGRESSSEAPGAFAPQLLREDVEITRNRTVSVAPNSAPSATLHGNLKFRGETLEHWFDRHRDTADPDEVDSLWYLEFRERSSGATESVTIPGDQERYQVELAPARYDVFVDERSRHQHIATGRSLSSPSLPGTVHGERPVAENLRVEEDTRLDVEFRPKRFGVDIETKNFERKWEDWPNNRYRRWALRFVPSETEPVLSQRIALDSKDPVTWMYPGAYEVWLQPYSVDSDGVGLYDYFDGQSFLIDGNFEVPEDVPLEGKAELVELKLRARLDETPIREWLPVDRERRSERPLSVQLQGVRQPRGVGERGRGVHVFSSLWGPHTPSEEGLVSAWVPPGDYDVFAKFHGLTSPPMRSGFQPVGSLQLSSEEQMHTVSARSEEVEISVTSNGTPQPEQGDDGLRPWLMTFRPAESRFVVPLREQFAITAEDELIPDGEASPRRLRMVSGTYRATGTYRDGRSRPASYRENPPEHEFSPAEPWSPSDGDLELDVEYRNVGGLVRLEKGDPDQTSATFFADDEWHLRFQSVTSDKLVSRDFKGVESNYETWVASGVYDVYFSPGHWSANREAAIPRDWRVARCIRID